MEAETGDPPEACEPASRPANLADAAEKNQEDLVPKQGGGQGLTCKVVF